MVLKNKIDEYDIFHRFLVKLHQYKTINKQKFNINNKHIGKAQLKRQYELFVY